MMDTQWSLVENFTPSQLPSFAAQLRIPESIARVLLNRGIDTYEKAKTFFRPHIKQLHDPFLMKDMDIAVDRMVTAIRNKENITIYGDYDVDGTTSVALLYLFLKQVGVTPRFFIPDRMRDGYGISADGIREIHKWGTDLIVSTDCGITAADEVAFANRLGMDVIISDHHEPLEILPEALAVLNPKREDCEYPFQELAGIGVTFKLIQGISKALQLDEKMYLQHLDLVAIGSAADIVPLIGENRILVSAGLEQLNTTEKVGIKALLNSAGLCSQTMSTGQVVFIIAPRINAVGRMGSASRAVHLLVSDSEQQANNIATILETENRNRRNIDEETFRQALDILEEQFDPAQDRIIVLDQKDWHPGVIGIVASRIVEKYYRPTVMIALENGTGKGSARSIPGFDIYQALKHCEKLMLGFGGHKYAAGLSIRSERIPLLKQELNLYAQEKLDENVLVPKIKMDGILQLGEIDNRFVRILNMMPPFGPQNMRPVFMGKNFEVVGTPQVVGSNHLKFKVRQDGVVIDAIGFDLGDLLYRLEPGRNNLDMVFDISENEYVGRKTLQLRVKDLR